MGKLEISVFQAGLSNSERNLNALRALAKLVPYAGEALDQVVFGHLDELRWKRVEKTLEEILQLLATMGRHPIPTEELANLIEKAIPKIARATAEDTRERFRDLLAKAALVPAGDDRWAQAYLAEELLSELEAPALSILAVRARFRGERAFLFSRPTPQIIDEETFKIASTQRELTEVGPHAIQYTWPVVDEWTRRLQEKRLVGFGSVDARGGFGDLVLTRLGRMLVDWTVSESV